MPASSKPTATSLRRGLWSSRHAAALLGSLLLASCGGGRDAGSADASSAAAATEGRARILAVPAERWVKVPAEADPLLQNLTIPADAPTRGMWSAVKEWPLNALHVAVLPNGKLLSYGTTLDGGAQNGRYFDVWDPSLGFAASAHQTTYRADQQDSFCSTAAYLTDGRLMVTGGNGAVTSTLYTPSSNTVAQSSANLADQRWYGTMLTLPDGRQVMLGGMDPYAEFMQDNPADAVARGLASMTPEVFEADAWRSLTGGYSREAFGPDFLRASYPRAWISPAGRVFGVSAERMWTLNPAGNGAITVHGAFKSAPDNTARPNVGATNTAVMYDIGKVMIAGGNGSFNGDGRPASALATSININGAEPVLTELPAMANARRYPNSIVLPDGRVLVTGGTKVGNNNGADSVFAAETWNPASNTWTTGASAAVYRGYHSFTVLLPNGTVLSTGGGTPGPVTNLNAEVYYPPQLFRTVNNAAQLAPRPVMSAISGLSYAHGGELQIDMSSAGTISSLVMLGVSNGTHSFNAGQRRIPLAFTQESFRLTATVPNANLVPPGYYQVVAIDAAGVPSRGVIVAVGQGVAAPPVTTTPYSPPAIGGAIDAPIIAAGGTASYTVPAVTGVTYSWDFGDGTAVTSYVANPATTHVFAQAGLYTVTLTAKAADGSVSRRTIVQAVSGSVTARKPNASSALALETRTNASARMWVANPDTDTVAVIDTANNTRVAEIAVGSSPRSVGIAPDGRMWVVNKGSASISIINAGTLAVAQTVALPRASQPHGLAFAPGGTTAFVVLEATGQLLKLDAANGATVGAALAVGANPRHVAVSGDAATVLVSRFITPLLPGESTATVDTSTAGAEVVVVKAAAMTIDRTVVLRHSDKTDTEIQGAGIPNYLGAAAISPDGASAWVPSKQDNIKRGTLRNGQNLDFQNTVRAITSRINLASLAEDLPRRIDHDNASVGSAAAFHPTGVYLFVALETSRQVAVINAFSGGELFRIEAGRAPQALALSADGRTLYVQNFMDRSVTVADLSPLVANGELRVASTTPVASVATEKLAANVLVGKQLFYDARDPRLARDSYMSCASCHNDAGRDGRVWDFTGFGEGLRRTTTLAGKAGTAQGFVHWSANFDEIQDFEGQIRSFAGGTGLMTDAQFNTGTRNTPLGDKKAGISADLDALAAYLGSLGSFAASPNRQADGTLTTAAAAGKTVFANANCASCHNSVAFSISGDASTLRSIGTVKSTSGKRLNAALNGIDVPTLRDVWVSGPYLHDGSAATLDAAVQAHSGTTLTAADLANVVAYLKQIGGDEPGPGTGGTATNLAPSATLATSFVSGWEKLAAVNDNVSPANSADNASGAYGNWNGEGNFGATNWVSFTWSAPRVLTAFEVYWWNDNQGIATPTAAVVEYWNGSIWVPLGKPGLALNAFNRLNFAAISTTSIRVAMSSARATGILEARVFGTVPGGSNQPPTVTLTAPANNASVTEGSAVTLTATAADTDGTVARVEFYDGATLLATDTTAPYSISWTSAGVGTHTLTARAVDNSGAVTTSTAVSVTVTAAAPTATNIAPSATLDTSYVSGWETLAAVNNNIVPANSADKTGGAYGNWKDTASYGATNWVSFTWSAAKTMSAFEVYWWNDGLGIATPTAAKVEYWNGTAWVSLGNIGLALNQFNRLTFTAVSTTKLRVSMSSVRATGILEARAFGY